MRQKPTEQTIKKLFALSGNICAFPGCDQKIFDTHGTLIGEICHIEAANQEGERFNKTQSDQERASFENLILLCANHHKVTNDVSIYTVATLKAMKLNHESHFKEHPYPISKKELGTVLSSIENNLAQIAKNTASTRRDPYEMNLRFVTCVTADSGYLALEGMNTGDRTITLSSWGFGLPDNTYLTQLYMPPIFAAGFRNKIQPGENVLVGFEYFELGHELIAKGYSGKIRFSGFFKDQIGHKWSTESDPFDIDEYR